MFGAGGPARPDSVDQAISGAGFLHQNIKGNRTINSQPNLAQNETDALISQI